MAADSGQPFPRIKYLPSLFSPIASPPKVLSKIYLLIGDHKPMNNELAQYAAQTITVKGKAVSRDGLNMIENAEIVK